MAKKKKKKKLTIGKVYTKKKNLSYKKKLSKKESKKYTKLEKKAKKVVYRINKKLSNYEKKLKKGGLTKTEKKKLKKKKKSLQKSAKSNKNVKALNKYKKKLDKKYIKKKTNKKTTKTAVKANTQRSINNIGNNIKSKATNRAYMIDEDTLEVFIFQFNPEKVPYERKVTYNTIDSPGQAYPQTQFAKGEVLEFSVELFMYTPVISGGDIKTLKGSVYGKKNTSYAYETRKYADGETRTVSTTGLRAVDNRIGDARKFLENLLPPMVNKNSFKRPHLCTFAFGYFVQNKCVVTSLKVEDERLDSRGVPIQTKFDITLRKV